MDPLTRRRAEIDRRRLRGLTVLLLSLALMGFVLFDSKVPAPLWLDCVLLAGGAGLAAIGVHRIYQARRWMIAFEAEHGKGAGSRET
jgi:peptidoglycan/LPS O-acetylase OafA/YrhL